MNRSLFFFASLLYACMDCHLALVLVVFFAVFSFIAHDPFDDKGRK